jgi:phosphoribosylamine--glycine ligase
MSAGDGWELTTNPKSKRKPTPEPNNPGGAGAEELPGTPRHKPKPEESGGHAVGGAEEMPGTPRQKPKTDSKPTPQHDDPARQRPGALEEDAEIWVAPAKGGAGWTTPAGTPTGDAIPPKPEGAAPVDPKTPLYEDEDVEVTSSPRPKEDAPQPFTLRASAGGPTGGGKVPFMPSRAGMDVGEDSEIYVSGQAKPANAPPATAAPRPQGSRSPGPLRVLLVGGGAREHAMAMALTRAKVEVHAVLKHRNPGLTKSAAAFRLLAETDIQPILAWARGQKVDVAIIGPESPLEAGLSDALRAAGIPVASPSKAAAQIETDKTFMRTLMAKHNLGGQLGFHPFKDAAGALAFLDKHGPKWAIKPVGLTGGKGVQVFGDHFKDLDGAKAYVRSIFQSKVGGGAVQFEELAIGEEFTVMAFTDGKAVVPMPAVQDHKRLRDGDQGPNTGGMGSYSQADGLLPFLARSEYDQAVRIVESIVAALAAEGTPYVGPIYGQFMLTADGPRIIEVNARFGDPEAVNVVHILESNFADIVVAMAQGTLAQTPVKFRPRATVVKYVVPQGYGEGAAHSGAHIQIDEFNIRRAGATAYYANIEQAVSGSLATMTSRTLAMLGEADTVAEAEAVCEKALKHVHGEHLFVRHDIGTEELLARRVEHMRMVRGGAAGRVKAQATL